MQVNHAMICAAYPQQAIILDSRACELGTNARWFLLEVPIDGIYQEVWQKLPLDGTKKREGNREYWVA